MQLATEVAPRIALYFPGAHAVHVLCDVAAAAELHLPCSHGVQLAAGTLDHVPAEQFVHRSEPGIAKEPIEQVRQVPLDTAPTAFEYRPAAQLVHETPTSAPNVPAAQLTQLKLELEPGGLDFPIAHRFPHDEFDVEPDTLLQRPGRQLRQSPPASALYFPAAQLVQKPLELEPAGLDWPGAQRLEHDAFEIAATVVLHLPGGQDAHSVALDIPVALLNVPAEQLAGVEEPSGQ